MLEIAVVVEEMYDEEKRRFLPSSTHTVRLEHSLISLSKWESIWEEPFLGKKSKTPEQTLSYIKQMVVEGELPSAVFLHLCQNHLSQIEKYIESPQTATKIYVDPKAPASREIVTSELIYYWMFSLKIPFECERWHLNRLLTLIRVFNVKNSPKSKMSAAERRQLNRQRLAKYNTRG